MISLSLADCFILLLSSFFSVSVLLTKILINSHATILQDIDKNLWLDISLTSHVECNFWHKWGQTTWSLYRSYKRFFFWQATSFNHTNTDCSDSFTTMGIEWWYYCMSLQNVLCGRSRRWKVKDENQGEIKMKGPTPSISQICSFAFLPRVRWEIHTLISVSSMWGWHHEMVSLYGFYMDQSTNFYSGGMVHVKF